MAPATPTTNNNPSDDELDAILTGIVDGQDIFDTSNIQAQVEPSKQRKHAAPDSGLGIDEEIKIVKKRQPIPKLDEDRLLSDAGISKLRRTSKERLKFKGKGHEYGDIARMLNMYQLWLDDLYPRAKFADGLAMIEKLGHTKTIQNMRKEWIDEGKPRRTIDTDPEEAEQVPPVETVEQTTEQMEGVQIDTPGEDSESGKEAPVEAQQQAGESVRASSFDDPDEDELDALLAESAAPGNPLISALPANVAAAEGDVFADEMEAMAEMEHMC